MEKLNFSDFSVIRMDAHSIQLKINGKEYHATKRVANEIFAGARDNVYVQTRDFQGQTTEWLATPCRF